MNPQVKRRMMVFPTIAFKQSAPNSRQVTTDIGQVAFRCYVMNSIKVVMSKHGREEISGMQLYVLGEDIVKIDTSDKLTVSDPQGTVLKVRQEPLKVDVYYKPGGIPEIGVIYLQ